MEILGYIETMNDLTERQRILLTLVVRDYIETAEPVGSKTIVERYKLDMSTATVRNEMATLTEMGYLRQPHTSAGRVPTEEGYRYFVTHVVYQADLPGSARDTISHQFYQARQDVEQWMPLAASILAYHSRAASIVTAPHSERSYYKHVELIATQGRQVLMVLVMTGGEVSQQILTLAEPVRQQHLSLDGLTNVLSEPEFLESTDARRAVHLFEERSLLQDLLARTTNNATVGGVQVLIGGEGKWEDLKECSVVLARYGIPGLVTGTLGDFGPIRIPSGGTIPTVRFMADLLSGLVSETMVGEENEQ